MHDAYGFVSRSPIADLARQDYDVVVIGAGAVGCAAARELAGRGFRTLLVDRGDIGAGTSSRSSRMLYSGVGYLAPPFPLWQIPFRLGSVWKRFLYARNIMHCRAELLADMPQRLTRHRFFYPFRQGDLYPHWLVEFGFRLMELTSSRGVKLSFRRLPPQQAAEQSALVAALGGPLASIGSFEEYMYNWPERICVDTALDAEARGATIRTYAKVRAIAKAGEQWLVHLDEQAPESQGSATIRTHMVVNAAGPWVDRIAGGEALQPRVIGKKGVNLMLRLPDSWRGQGLEAFSSKGETFYVFPWREFHFVGPTEAIMREDPDDVRVLDSEIDYILGEVNLLFPGLALTRDQVLHCWCGVRPMSTEDGETVSLPVRAITDPRQPGLVTMTGSYIMMHRHAGRLAAKAVEKQLGKRRKPAKGLLSRPASDRLEVIVRQEHVVRLADLIRRRLPDGLNATLGEDRAEQLSHIAAAAMGWSEQRRHQELQHFHADTDRVYRNS